MGFKRKPANFFNRVAYWIEVIIAFTLLAAVVVLFIELVRESHLFNFDGDHVDFTAFLSSAFKLIFGVEFTNMLCGHTPETVVDVLVFAVAGISPACVSFCRASF